MRPLERLGRLLPVRQRATRRRRVRPVGRSAVAVASRARTTSRCQGRCATPTLFRCLLAPGRERTSRMTTCNGIGRSRLAAWRSAVPRQSATESRLEFSEMPSSAVSPTLEVPPALSRNQARLRRRIRRCCRRLSPRTARLQRSSGPSTVRRQLCSSFSSGRDLSRCRRPHTRRSKARPRVRPNLLSSRDSPLLS
jgi:hypothetical protein